MPGSKRLSKVNQAREEGLQDLVRQQELKEPNLDSRNDAEAFLTHHFSLDVKTAADPIDFWIMVKGAVQQLLVRNAHHRYREAIAYAYAVYEYISNSGESIGRHLRYIYEAKNPAHNPDILLATLRMVIKYGNGWRGDASRDAQAIRYLISQGIGPHEVETFYAANGGGVDAWSRAYSKLLKGADNLCSPETVQNEKDESTHTTRTPTRYVPKKHNGKFSIEEDGVSVDLETIQPGEIWAVVLIRDDEGLRISETSCLGRFEGVPVSDAIEAWLKMGSTFFP